MKGFEEFQMNVVEANKVKGGMAFQNGQPGTQAHTWEDIKETVVDIAEDLFIELFDGDVQLNIPPEYANLYLTIRGWFD